MPMQNPMVAAACDKQEFGENQRKLSEGSTTAPASTPPISPFLGVSPSPLNTPCELGTSVAIGYRAELWSEEYDVCSPVQTAKTPCSNVEFGYRAELWSDEYDAVNTPPTSPTQTFGKVFGYRAELWSDECA